MKRFVARLRRKRGITAADVVIPVETGPGEVAQVDFGYVGKIYDSSVGHRRKTWVFVMTLGFSRRPSRSPSEFALSNHKENEAWESPTISSPS